MKLRVLAGAGNTFAVVDGTTETLPADVAGVARRLCARGWRGELPALDGMLVVTRSAGADCRMKIYNADGSSPEACGNGLRLVAKFAREQGFTHRDQLEVETDAGVRGVELVRDRAGVVVAARARMGVPRGLERDVRLVTSRGAVLATLVDMGNPHCVLFVDDERTSPVSELGRELEFHPRFPARTNVEFAAMRNERLFLRVWERGVGETAACGTGACATAVAAALEGKVSLPVDVELPGGRLTVDWGENGEVVLSGPCEDLWSGEIALEGASSR
ncbi:MAG: diaminopimelate epimerase [Planctomycetes bacterium]|nr:diaminopimelate epimerase [Planctomycetota bacterium]